ncbi:AAA family ATPase [Pseudooctadecabacter jejudonensis]|uniref:Shikimate kinase n=1 Tax=Pseudooctadecabacter jejudonensis TaxID=1391910 RepID=A0A1Y5SUA9_9RHOB|nr:AAA family ATPase [Pseudooctadecabacter jejudonensis]SLN45319.1 hypothetical protein PSJ8397_02370 [Pseudooctadecabacter jejudonensis]
MSDPPTQQGDFVIILGAPAVGKMTVGQALSKRTGYPLFHNHITIEVAAPYFSYGTPEGRALVGRLRDAFFDAFEASTAQGYIFTFACAYDIPGERDYITSIAARFEARGRRICWVELSAPFETRRIRNQSENRLAHKPTKRDLHWSDTHLRGLEDRHRFTCHVSERASADMLLVNTENLSAESAADRIQTHFGLPDNA